MDHTGVSEIDKEEAKFKLYPNPNSGEMQLAYNLNDNETGYINIINLLGEKVNTYKLTRENNILHINEKQLKSGVYFYQLFINDNLVHSDKIILNK